MCVCVCVCVCVYHNTPIHPPTHLPTHTLCMYACMHIHLGNLMDEVAFGIKHLQAERVIDREPRQLCRHLKQTKNQTTHHTPHTTHRKFQVQASGVCKVLKHFRASAFKYTVSLKDYVCGTSARNVMSQRKLQGWGEG